jgi:hypothetical protein
MRSCGLHEATTTRLHQNKTSKLPSSVIAQITKLLLLSHDYMNAEITEDSKHDVQ